MGTPHTQSFRARSHLWHLEQESQSGGSLGRTSGDPSESLVMGILTTMVDLPWQHWESQDGWEGAGLSWSLELAGTGP